jgi:hypothetical protein
VNDADLSGRSDLLRIVGGAWADVDADRRSRPGGRRFFWNAEVWMLSGLCSTDVARIADVSSSGLQMCGVNAAREAKKRNRRLGLNLGRR